MEIVPGKLDAWQFLIKKQPCYQERRETMLKGRHLWLRFLLTRSVLMATSLLCLCCVLFFSLIWLALSFLSTHTILPQQHATPTLEVTIGFDMTYRSDAWTPVNVTLSNPGPTFHGTLTVKSDTEDIRQPGTGPSSLWKIEQPVTLQRNIPQQLLFYAPNAFSYAVTRGFVATLYDTQGKQIATQTSEPGAEMKPGDLLIGTLSEPGVDFSALDKVNISTRSASLVRSPLDASTLPALETVLENFDVIILDDFSGRTLKSKQVAALRTWVNHGGMLIEVGGPQWEQTLAFLPSDMLPVTIHGTEQLPAQTHLLPINGPVDPSRHSSDILDHPLTVSAANVHQQSAFSKVETLLSAHALPVVVQAHQGAGIIDYVAFDPASSQLATKEMTGQIWQTLLIHALGNTLLVPNTAEMYSSGPGEVLTRGGIIKLLAPNLPLIPWLTGVLLLGYVLLLGPVRMFFVRRSGRSQWWNWRIVFACILVFTLLTYGLSAYQKNNQLANNSISLIRIDQAGTSAHITTYMGLFLPNQGNFNLHIPGEGLVQAVPSEVFDNNSSVVTRTGEPVTLTPEAGAANLSVHANDRWSLTPVVAEQDRQLSGSLVTHLSLQNNQLVGTITNTLGSSLSDLFVLFPHSFVPIGQLAAGETRTVNSSLHSVAPDTGLTLADQIAAYGGLSTAYFPDPLHKQTETSFQSHVSLLSALSGNGYKYPPCNGSCLTHAIAARGNIYITGGQVPNPNLKNDYDPLLVAGAPATLIGWPDQPLAGIDTATINGYQPSGNHTALIQMPINLSFEGPVQVPRDFITGDVVDIQSYDVQSQLPGIYTISSGNVTFELLLPTTPQLDVHSLTITVQDLVAHPSDPGIGSTRDSKVQARLYNWQKHSWENINLSQDTFTTTTPALYAGPDGRILVTIASKDNTQLYFGKPTLAINGTATT